MNILQYNAIQPSFDIALLTGSSEVHLHTSVAHMQYYCREIACEALAQGAYTVTVWDEARTRTLRVTGRAL